MTRIDEEVTPNGEPKSGRFATRFWKVVNAILGLLTVVVLGFAVYIPPAIGRGGTPTERTWQAAGVVVFLLGVFAVIKMPRFSVVFLILSCAFFFVSCAANFHWKGG